MKAESIDYYKTVKENELHYDYKSLWLAFSILIFTLICGSLIYALADKFISNLLEPSIKSEYLFGALFTILAISFYCVLLRKILGRHKIKEIGNYSNPIITKKIIHRVASYLNWDVLDENDEILIFLTDLGPEMDRQLVTILLDPKDKILFSCIQWHKIHFRRTRFNDNYSTFKENYKKFYQEEMGKETAANTASSQICGIRTKSIT